MADQKTQPTSASVADFIAALADARRQAEAEQLLALYREVTGDAPQMWGPSIIGFGQYHYRYESGREGDSCRSGFSPRKAKLVIYLTAGLANPQTQPQMDALRAQLGPHTTGASCLYIASLAKVDAGVLAQMIRLDRAWMDANHP